ncbi:MAG: GGDEF domain-containing protein [Chloroflexi bacterium]|nr:GGDEF domain-containing protein [Chloroflexota bacterium]
MSAVPAVFPHQATLATDMQARLRAHLEEVRGRYRLTLARVVLVALAICSVNSGLSALVNDGVVATDYWYLYLSPVLVSALSFGLRGALVATAATVVAISALDVRIQTFALAEQARVRELTLALLTASPSSVAAVALDRLPDAPDTVAAAMITFIRGASEFGMHAAQVLGGVLVLCITGGIVGWQIDVARQRERDLLALARQDALTGALSRSAWLETLDDEILRARRYGRGFTLLLLDVDALQVINDQLGRSVGNQALQFLAEAVRGQTRATDRLGRLGGDELGLLVIETNREQGVAVGRRLLGALMAQRLDLADGRMVELGLSIGIAVYPDDGEDREPLLAAAEAALARAKAAGGRALATPRAEDRVEKAETAAPEVVGPQIFPRLRRMKAQHQPGNVIPPKNFDPRW